MEHLKEYEAMAKLNLPAEEAETISRTAETLQAAFDQLAAIETAQTKPMVTVLDLHTVLREDVVNQTISRETLLDTAPEQYDGYFQVPKTLE